MPKEPNRTSDPRAPVREIRTDGVPEPLPRAWQERLIDGRYAVRDAAGAST